MRPIVIAPDEKLRQSTQPVTFSGPKLANIISEMKKILVNQKDPEGVGLAANQIGLPLRLFIARFDTKPNEPIHVFINPEILEHSQELQPEKEEKAPLEGCLSLPNYYGVVKRWQWVKVRFQTFQNNQTTQKTRSVGKSDSQKIRPSDSLNKSESSDLSETTETFSGFPATVIQHEMDHLQGKIFVEKILEQKGKLYKATGKNKRGKDIWEEVELI